MHSVNPNRLCKQVYYMDVQTINANMSAREGLNILRLVGISNINDGSDNLRMMETRIVSNIVVWNNQKTALTYPTGVCVKLIKGKASLRRPLYGDHVGKLA